MSVSRTITFYELKKADGKIIRMADKGPLDMLKADGDTLTEHKDVLTSISDNDFVSAASFKVHLDKDGKPISGKVNEKKPAPAKPAATVNSTSTAPKNPTYGK